MIRRTTRSTRTDTLFPYTTLFRSPIRQQISAERSGSLANPTNFSWMTPLNTAPKTTAWMRVPRSEEHTSELQSLMRNSYAVFCLKKQNQHSRTKNNRQNGQETDRTT